MKTKGMARVGLSSKKRVIGFKQHFLQMWRQQQQQQRSSL
jgi:hypothetical protein